ncbi:MAG: 7,8-didemethyl-8-hydroxy-5-deazariboflavin synthase CofG [Nitrososphaeraceae archaeon]
MGRKISDMLKAPINNTLQESLDRCLEGKDISKDEAYEIINWDENDEYMIGVARKIRNRAKGFRVTYSRKVFINLVNLCRDTCSYCTYKKEPSDKLASLMSPQHVRNLAETGKKFGCTEVLFVTGERPEQKYLEARQWLRSLGYSSTIEYIREMSEKVLQETGLLPHTNAGSLTKKEMSILKSTNVSIGAMLESASERLILRGMPHENAPSKNPRVRLRTLQNAGELKIPTTTGLLVGIGETPREIVDSLFLIKEIHQRYGHIQEVIMQNFNPKPKTNMANSFPPSYNYFLKTIALARIILPEMNIQVPPNLTPNIFGNYIDAGINDWGGISPITIDHVNPEFPWPSIQSVNHVTVSRGHKFRARLPIYPEFLDKKDGFIPTELRNYIHLLSDSDGLVREDYINCT